MYSSQGILIRQHSFPRGILACALIRFGRSQLDKEFHRLGGSLHAVVGEPACDHLLDGHTLRLAIHRDGDLLPELLLQYRGKVLGALGAALRVSGLARFEARMARRFAGANLFSGLVARTIHGLLRRLVRTSRHLPDGFCTLAIGRNLIEGPTIGCTGRRALHRPPASDG